MPRPSRWDDVVAASAKVFRRRGFEGASLDEIAEELGMWKGSLYNYIKTKEDLLEAVVRRPAEDLLQSMRELAATDLPPSERLRRMTRAHVEVLEHTYDFAAVYLHEVAGRGLGPEWTRMDHEYRTVVQQVVADGVADGSFSRSTDPHVATMALIGALNWLTRWWDPAGPLSAAAIADQISNLVLAGLLSRRPRAVDAPFDTD